MRKEFFIQDGFLLVPRKRLGCDRRKEIGNEKELIASYICSNPPALTGYSVFLVLSLLNGDSELFRFLDKLGFHFSRGKRKYRCSYFESIGLVIYRCSEHEGTSKFEEFKRSGYSRVTLWKDGSLMS